MLPCSTNYSIIYQLHQIISDLVTAFWEISWCFLLDGICTLLSWMQTILSSQPEWLIKWSIINLLFIDNFDTFCGYLTLLGRDGLHPTQEGANTIAENILKSLKMQWLDHQPSNHAQPYTTTAIQTSIEARKRKQKNIEKNQSIHHITKWRTKLIEDYKNWSNRL